MSLKKLLSRLSKRLGIGHRTHDLDDELQFHLEREIEQNVAAGMSPDEARRRALIAFGGVQQIKESVKQVYWLHFWEIMLQDARYGLRMLRKSPGFTLSSVMILALGIGMNSAIFSLIDDILLRALPVKNPQSLLLLRWHARKDAKSYSYSGYGDCSHVREKANPSGCSFSLPFFQAAQSHGEVFESLSAFAGAGQIALSDNGPATVLNYGEFVSGNYFQTLGVQAEIGRTLQPADDTPSASPVLMLGYGYWQTAFGGDTSVVGRTIRLNGNPFTIVGVVQHGFDSLTPGHQHDLFMPLSLHARLMPDWTPSYDNENSWWLILVGRLKPGVAPAQAEAAMTLLYRNQTLANGKLFVATDEPGVALLSAQQGLVGSRDDVLRPLYVLLLTVGVILLVACANVAGLMLARSTARAREIAVRLTLGARRGRVLVQLLVESLMLALMGGVAGLFLAYWGARAMVAIVGTASGDRHGPHLTPHLDIRLLAFTAAASILTGVIFGLIPAFRSLRLDLTRALKSGSANSSAGASCNRWYSLGNSLVVAQVGLAMVALVVAGLLVRSLTSLRNVNVGFETRNLLLFGIDPTLTGYKDQQVDSLYRDLEEQFAALPGIASVSYSWSALLSGSLWTTNFHAHGTPEKEAAEMAYLPVSPGFFKTMAIPMKAGRDFTYADFAIAAAAIAARNSDGARRGHLSNVAPNLAPVPVIVNETFVRRYFPNTNPLGQYLEPAVPSDPSEPKRPGWQIIGVVEDAKYYELRGDVDPTAYGPHSGGQAFFELRVHGDPAQLVPTLRDLVNRKDPNLALFRISTQLEEIDHGLFVDRLLAKFSTFFSLLALMLACIGLYGLLSYDVARRTREIGIRMAVGAQQHNVIRMVVTRAVALAVAGAVIGIVASLGVARLLISMLYGVKPGDPVTLAGVATLLLLVTLAACYFPARRATRVDPLVALRYE